MDITQNFELMGRDKAQLEAALKSLPESALSFTPSGKVHALYSDGSTGPSVEIREIEPHSIDSILVRTRTHLTRQKNRTTNVYFEHEGIRYTILLRNSKDINNQ